MKGNTFMKNETCVIEGCTNHAPYADYCHTHYVRNRKTGSPQAERSVRRYQKGGSTGKCLYCERPAETRKMCRKHYSRTQIHGDPNHERKQRELCREIVDGNLCGKPATAHFKCRYHYDKARREITQ